MSNKLQKNNHGFAHLGLLLVVVLVLGVIAFSVNRIRTSSVNRSTNASTSDEASDLKGGDDLDGLSEQELVNNTIADDETGGDSNSSSSSDDGDPGVDFVNFTKGGGSLVDNKTVNVTFVADQALPDGECKFLFTLGNSSVPSTTAPTNSNQCHTKVPLSEFPKSGIWYATVAYDSSDGSLTGVGGGIPIEVMPTITEVKFTKGGSGINGDVLSVSANMDKTVIGTCTYTFSLNGTIRVEKQSYHKGDNFCKVDVPVSSFPKSATYNMVISFVSSDGYTQGSTSWDVTIN